MEKKTQWMILFSILIAYYIFWEIFSDILPSNLNFVLWGVWILIIICFFYWITKNTNFFKKIPLKERPKHRLQEAEELGFISIGIYTGYILGFLLMGLGISFLFSNRPDSFDAFLGTTILGLVVIIIMFFANKKIKKEKKA